MSFSKYKQNLRREGNNIISYTTIVAKIESPYLVQLGWWSVTTQKHINYAACELGLELVTEKDLDLYENHALIEKKLLWVN